MSILKSILERAILGLSSLSWWHRQEEALTPTPEHVRNGYESSFNGATISSQNYFDLKNPITRSNKEITTDFAPATTPKSLSIIGVRHACFSGLIAPHCYTYLGGFVGISLSSNDITLISSFGTSRSR